MQSRAAPRIRRVAVYCDWSRVLNSRACATCSRFWHKHGYLLAAERATDVEIADRARCLPRSLDVQSTARSARSAHRQVSYEPAIIVPSYRSAHCNVLGECGIGERCSPNGAIAIVSGERTGPQPNSVAVPDEAALQRVGCGCYEESRVPQCIRMRSCTKFSNSTT